MPNSSTGFMRCGVGHISLGIPFAEGDPRLEAKSSFILLNE